MSKQIIHHSSALMALYEIVPVGELYGLREVATRNYAIRSLPSRDEARAYALRNGLRIRK